LRRWSTRCDDGGVRSARHLTLVDITTVDPSQAAALLAARQRELTAANPGTSMRYTDATAMAELLASSPAERGIGACDGSGRLVGWLGGNASGIFGFARSVHHALDGSWPDPTGLYGRMYAQLASEWRDAGVLVHDVEVPTLPAIESAWLDLGFGRRTCFAVRATREAARARSTRVEVRIGGEDDLDAIARLALGEAEARNEPPLFAQQPALRVEDFTRAHRDLLRHGAVHFLARLDGHDLGLLTLEFTSPAPLLTADDAPFIGPTGVDPASRGTGVGRALVDAALRWCREHDLDHVGVSYNTSNLSSRPFWRGWGFQATGWKLARRLPPA
jgi:GNAT superfamily N-acetyltransferase